ncbi:hypothetical protein [Rhodococcus sp. AQ5-07]|uniref:hypothetical protein n=1 Tax=Rhodococcus sp. AQ5-07 TaxID=2054902 RepID=UPI0012B58DD6|nr:hypothetical protein [Rhodococcus sp. AQ5-07]
MSHSKQTVRVIHRPTRPLQIVVRSGRAELSLTYTEAIALADRLVDTVERKQGQGRS